MAHEDSSLVPADQEFVPAAALDPFRSHNFRIRAADHSFQNPISGHSPPFPRHCLIRRSRREHGVNIDNTRGGISAAFRSIREASPCPYCGVEENATWARG